jgi:hypothetical protein
MWVSGVFLVTVVTLGLFAAFREQDWHSLDWCLACLVMGICTFNLTLQILVLNKSGVPWWDKKGAAFHIWLQFLGTSLLMLVTVSSFFLQKTIWTVSIGLSLVIISGLLFSAGLAVKSKR